MKNKLGYCLCIKIGGKYKIKGKHHNMIVTVVDMTSRFFIYENFGSKGAYYAQEREKFTGRVLADMEII